MIIPKNVKVGNFIYDVQITEEPILLDFQVCSGLCDSHNQIIKIDANLTQQNKERVFLHELLHCMAIDKELEFGEETEHVIDSLAKSLHGILVDNKMLFMNEEILETLLDEMDNCCCDCDDCVEEDEFDEECKCCSCED